MLMVDEALREGFHDACHDARLESVPRPGNGDEISMGAGSNLFFV